MLSLKQRQQLKTYTLEKKDETVPNVSIMQKLLSKLNLYKLNVE
jgi:hypothetical protein